MKSKYTREALPLAAVAVRRFLLTLMAGMVLLLMAGPSLASGVDSQYPVVHKYFPRATRFGAVTGKPPAAPVYQDKQVIGYVFESGLVAPVPAYSGKSVNVLVAIDTQGKILGTKVLEQHEPIFLIGIPVQKLYDFVQKFVGHNIRENIVVGTGSDGSGGPNSVSIDAISSATVTSMAVNQTIMDAALKVAASRKLVSASSLSALTPHAKVRSDYYQPATWQTLTGNGAIRHLHVTRKQVAEAFKNAKQSEVVDDVTSTVSSHVSKNTFIDLYYGDITPPTVGRNLLGKSAYDALKKKLNPGDEAIAVVANGVYSFKGIGYVRGGLFDRLHVMQNNNLILFHDTDFKSLVDTKLAGMPNFQEKAIFIIRKAFEFDPGKPWTLQLVVRRQVGPLKSVYHTFHGGYSIPAAYVTHPKPPKASPVANAPLWVKIWYHKRFQIGGLAAGLLLLSLIVIFQDRLAQRHPVALERVRTAFLVYTLVFIGWYGLAQLSVVNIFTFLHAVKGSFAWNTFLMDPLIFLLWSFVAISLLLLGRGIYCGWLCPFGAFQALVNKLARLVRIPQLEFPRAVHQRLWALKYIILILLFGLSLQSVNMAERFAEVEPFKTAIDLHFMRSLPFILYAAGLLLVSAFNHKFYCKYVCPLGAGLAVAGRFRLFEWLRRRQECGHPCKVCANECEVQAIDELGRINLNECHYCLDCQVTYWNDHKCPPLVKKRKRRTKLQGEAPVEAVASQPESIQRIPTQTLE